MKNPDKSKQAPGEILQNLNDKIEQLKMLLNHLDPQASHKSEHKYVTIPYGDENRALWDIFREMTAERLQAVEADRQRHLNDHPPPRIGELVCPYCGYDGEFENDIPAASGFRILEPILQPRLVTWYDGQTLSLSDPDELFDPFDCIADPHYKFYLDESDDPVERELRKALRGRWVFICGRPECQRYFDARDFVERAHINYTCNNPEDSKWRKKA